MKILYIYDAVFPYLKGGAEKRFWELASRLAKKGHLIDMVGIKSWKGEKNINKGVVIYGLAKKRELYFLSGQRKILPVFYFSFKLSRDSVKYYSQIDR